MAVRCKFKNIFFMGVDDHGVVKGVCAGVSAVIQVDMPVDKKAGLKLVQQVIEYFKPGMGQVVAVVDAVSGRMGQQDIKASPAQKGEPHVQYAAQHLKLGILMLAGLVAHGTAQSHDTDAVVYIDFVFNTDTAVRGSLFIPFVVIAVNVQNWRMGKGRQERQILWFEIAAGEDQVDPLQPAFIKVIP